MAAGTPVVISDQVHIYQDVVSAEAGWVGRCKIEDVANLIKLALHNEGERKRRGLNAKKLAKNSYSWQAIAKHTIQVYEKIIACK